MKVFQGDGYERRLVGTAAVCDWNLPFLEIEVSLNGAKRKEIFLIGTVSNPYGSPSGQVSQRAVLVSDIQDPTVLPGWQKLHS